jgi:hypothetical protein
MKCMFGKIDISLIFSIVLVGISLELKKMHKIQNKCKTKVSLHRVGYAAYPILPDFQA